MMAGTEPPVVGAVSGPGSPGGPPLQPTSSQPVPGHLALREQITPHRLAVVLLVREYTQYKADLALITPPERSKVCLLILGLVQAPDIDLTTLCAKVEESVPGALAATWAGGVARLQEEGVAGVMDLVQSIEKLLAPDIGCSVNRSSVIGLILRRVYLSFDKLTFSEVSALRQQVEQYYFSGRRALATLLEEPEGEQASVEPSMEMSLGGVSVSSQFPASSSLHRSSLSAPLLLEDKVRGVSRKQADLVIAQQASLLQTAESAALPPDQLQEEVGRILAHCPSLPEAHFLSYLNCLRVRDVTGAEHALYASFAMPVEPGTGLPKSSQEEINKGFRYAALNLALFHSRLGHTEEAVSAIREATRMAQEATDHTCLQHVLSLLYRTVDAGQKQRLMERCIDACGSLSLSYLASLGIQAFSQLAATTGESPEQVLELLTRSDVLNCQHSIASLQACGYMCKAAAWAQYGRSRLACTLSQLLLATNTADPARQGHNYQGEPTAIALANVALRLETLGHPGPADRIIATAERLFPTTRSEHSRVVSSGKQRILLWRALAQQDWTRAAGAVDILQANEVPDATLLRAELAFKQGKVVEAREVLQPILTDLGDNNNNKESTSAEVKVRSLLLLADIHCWSRDPAGAVQQLVKAAQLARSRRLELLAVQARLQVAHCQLLLGSSAASARQASVCLPALLAHGSLTDASRAWLLAAKARIAASHGASAAERRAELLQGATIIIRAKEGFSSAGDVVRVKDCLYLVARIYHQLNLTEERNRAAQQYKKLEDLYPVKTRVLLDCLL